MDGFFVLKSIRSMKIFETYTGNAMLNNALMTIEALGNLRNICEITPELLLRLYNDKGLLKLNKRIKSYTMLFTKNGPLHNDKANGEKIYDALFKTILSNFENEGKLACEISGLKFQTPFHKIFEKALRSIGVSEKEIQNKDTNIGRTWFPLIGGLGSDAQALPQAKFTVQIHPICIAILQFLPLSSFLYNGGILLIDSSNFEFAREFVSDNVQEIEKRIKATKSTDSIENIKDFSKGNYLLKAIKILEDKNLEETYSDLNLWSFSNSGTGASCTIDRVPNSLIQKLVRLKKSGATVRAELERILNRNESAYGFLISLEENKEWSGLYPNVFGTGKKKVEYEGVCAAFLEAYFRETGNIKQIDYAKYIAHLITEHKSKSFEKYLSSTSAWNEKTYRIDLYAVLVESTKKEKWSLHHQLQILDDVNAFPVRNIFYQLHRLIHYFYQKQIFITDLPTSNKENSYARDACIWLIALIQRDEIRERIIKSLTNTQDYISVGYTGLFIRLYALTNLNLKTIAHFLYDENFLPAKNGLNELLRVFFSQSDQEFFTFDDVIVNIQLETDDATEKWFEEFSGFARDYQAYYFDKYENKQTGRQPYGKFLKLVLDISMETSEFLYWMREAIENTNQFLNNQSGSKDTWSEALLYNPQGEWAISFAKLAIKFSLLKQYQLSYQQNQTVNS
jgi:hypothetical protein